ncbi:glycoside hydrolase family 95 protein [Tamlana sp. 2201CG12-4]|uniref:glycoside hydrolase family 95 protein n=1 Tax=Tamlana sp. 2201CG12-4 TaxID=3112582 RepID=UPI002DB556E0|nr:glycoside hydrolase family 95 protein [Tamlana sp. 2201CG12-4]MEC3908796.1 glycoside hydrolase family 95 protein [Tamlana sp. 2201CG12-4]
MQINLTDNYPYNMINIKKLIAIILLGIGISSVSFAQKEQKLWFDEPAENWNGALPIGNGRLGAMIFGNPVNERLQLNEETIWAKQGDVEEKQGTYKYVKQARSLLFQGKYKEANDLVADMILNKRMPSGTNTYQELGDLNLTFFGIDKVANYKRELSLDSALVNVTFRSNKVNYKRTYFSSAADKTLVARFTANKKKAISCEFVLTREELNNVISADKETSGEDATFMPSGRGAIVLEDDEIIMYEHIENESGVKFEARLQILHKGGAVKVIGNKLRAIGCDELELRLVCGTDYRGDNPTELSLKNQRMTKNKTYNQLLNAHVKDYQALFNRVDLDLGSNELVYLPTNQRLNAHKRGAFDPALLSLYFQYGRYLLISTSRPGSLPSNLQGIWCEGLSPIWNSDYHININIQMNNWPTGVTNLSECHEPFLQFVSRLRERGRISAKENYNARGFCAHHTTDAWHMTTLFGKPQYGMWPFGAAWASTHYWEDYLFTGNKTMLEELGYDVMKEASLFVLDFMVKHPKTGKYVTGPSMSPENSYFDEQGNTVSVDMGPSMDLQIAWHLFNTTIEASKVLNKDLKFRNTLLKRLEQMEKVKIGLDGRIMEWSQEFPEAYPGHRHISHLYGLYPSNQFNWKDTPEFLEASKKVLKERLKHGGGHTGWSRAWMINFYARLFDAEKVFENINLLLSKSTLPNLLDNHPPFQIDGNFGGTAGMAEMLLQSHVGVIHLLPALPKKLKNGSVKGLVARGGFEVNMEWQEGQLVSTTIISKRGGICNLRYLDIYKTFEMTKGEEITLSKTLQKIK